MRSSKAHSDTSLDGANIDAKVAGNAFIVFNIKDAIRRHGDGLMACVFADCIAASAFDAGILIDPCFGDMAEIKILPIHDLWYRGTDKVINGRVFLFIHPL